MTVAVGTRMMPAVLTAQETQARNKALAIHWLAMISDHDIDALCAITSPTWEMVGGPPSLKRGHAGLRELFAHIGPVRQQWTVDLVINEGEFVVTRATNRCEQVTFFGVPGVGIEQIFTATFIHRVVCGAIEQTWRNADDLGRLFQLGATIVPPR